MRKNNRYFLVFVVVFVGAVYLFSQRSQNLAMSPGVNDSSSSPSAGSSGVAPKFDKNGEPVSAGETTDSEGKTSASPEFVKWFGSEAKNLEKSSGDPKVTELTLREKVRAFTPAEVRFVKDQVLATNNSANDRILASYLLSLAPDVTTEALIEVAMAPLNTPKDFAVHSTTETLAAQEKSLRHMAIDALIDRARHDKGFRDELQKKIEQIPEASLREYAEKAYRRLQ